MEIVQSVVGHADPAVGTGHRGANQSGMRDHNERVVLSLLRKHGALSKSDIARRTSLSAQTASVIMRALEADGLLLRGEPQRGRIGQPSIPMSLDPEGAWFLGLKVGRRSAEVVAVDFLGCVRQMRQYSYPYPTPQETLAFARRAIAEIRDQAGLQQDARIAGLGIATPSELWAWAENAGAPPGAMDDWKRRDIGAELQADYPFPVYTQNDASAACGAELVFGKIGELRDFVYFYIGAFAGGGVVMDGRLQLGRSGNAGALGSMPVPGDDGRSVQLIDVASLAVLETQCKQRGEPSGYLWSEPTDWAGNDPQPAQWIEDAGRGLAHAIVAASSVFEFEAAVIDGWMPERIREELVIATRASLETLDVEGIRTPAIRAGTVGIHARALGAASIPLLERFLVSPNSVLTLTGGR